MKTGLSDESFLSLKFIKLILITISFFGCQFSYIDFSAAHNKAIVIPLTKGNGVALNQQCPGSGPVIGIDAEGKLICKTAIVFISSIEWGGYAGSIEGYDALCSSIAIQANLPNADSHHFKAWMSDSTTSPSVSFNKLYYPYVLTDGTLIAEDWYDLTDGTLAAPINIDENGNLVSNTFVWTGTNVNGTAHVNNCSDWSSSSGFGKVGLSSENDLNWSTYLNSQDCSLAQRIYCFQQ